MAATELGSSYERSARGTTTGLRVLTTHRAEHGNRVRYLWAGLRLGMGWVFLWAFLDKLFGLGFSTPAAKAWLAGGSPTMGFLSNSTGAWGVFKALAGNPVVDALFMLGLLGVGLALLLGIGLRIAACSGTAMLLLMWAAAPPRTNPFMDDHLIYAALLFGLAAVQAGNTWGLGAWWRSLPPVQRHPGLA